MNILFVFPNIDLGGYKPLAISSLIAVAKKLRHRVRLFDTSFYNVDEYSSNAKFVSTQKAGEEVLNFIPVDLSQYNFKKEKVDLNGLFLSTLREFKPDLVALSIFSQEYALGMHLMGLVKKPDPSIVTMVGGVHCYADPEGTLQNTCIDYLCMGEGEEVFEKALVMMESGLPPKGVSGLWYKNDGEIVRPSDQAVGMKPGTEAIQISRDLVRPQPIADAQTGQKGYLDLSKLPYMDYDEYDDRQFIRVFNGKVYRSADISLTRGCFERCIYCLFEKIYETYGENRTIRKYDVDRIICELEHLIKRYDLNFIRFQDSTFLSVSQPYFEEFARQYIKRIGVPFVIDSVPQAVNETKARLLKEMNCRSISIGVETGNEEFRMKYLDKQVTNKRILETFKIVRSYDIRTVSFILLGFPHETREMVFESISLVRQAKVNSPNVGFVYPFKGLRLREYALKEKLFDESVEINGCPQYSRNRPAIRNPHISENEYMGLYRTFPFYCKLPEKYYDKIKIAESLTKEGNAMYKYLKAIFEENALYDKTYDEIDISLDEIDVSLGVPS